MKDPHGTILWTSVDPLAEKYPENSPYLYCADNPVNYIDLFGLEGKTPEEAKNNWSDFNTMVD
ncbi:MAG: hypothetical protein IKR18_11940 [Bacteroidaceae bacterium]|nr:hypothetical protein [Bacteroidaceae bacterium]